MYKLIIWFVNNRVKELIILFIIFGFTLPRFNFSETISQIIVYILVYVCDSIIFYLYLFKQTSDCAKYILDGNIQEAEKIIDTLQNNRFYKKNITVKLDSYIISYYKYGLTEEITTQINKICNSHFISSKIKNAMLKSLCYMYLDNEKYDEANKTMNMITDAKIKSECEKEYDNIYKLLVNKDKTNKEKLVEKTKNVKENIVLLKNYYLLSIYCKKTGDLTEKDYLEKIMKYGEETYMEKYAQNRLKELS